MAQPGPERETRLKTEVGESQKPLIRSTGLVFLAGLTSALVFRQSGQLPLGLVMFLTSVRLPVPALCEHYTGAQASQILNTEFALSTEFTGLCQTLCV